ncbi:hypothetical protein [Cellulomonas triticagri]|uniref:Uncharacterized protein n=1 Tax=Cellulomonas triticagri TaxID=2483352 RepID=A0A3M2J8T7_9CELL|nr:hypothetical protein [Cellulomonas triticagri]RMI06888.1 hypothetical protein EBM89_14730 [Cellulomonas triticagri]
MTSYLVRILERERAARHARSIPLAAVTVALVVLAAVGRYLRLPGLWDAFLPGLTFLLVVAAMAVQRALRGAGNGRDGYGLVAVGLLLVPFLPFGLVAPLFVGAEALLGAGLVVLGWRGRDRGLWVPGLVLLALGPFVHLNGAAITLFWLPADPGVAVRVATAVAFAVLTGRAIRIERRRSTPVPAEVPA